MTPETFTQGLASDGFVEVETRRLEPRPANGEHGHHFTVRGLILDGAFTITLEGRPTTYGVGQSFEVAAGRMHFEEVPPGGVTLVTGRKY